MCRYESRDKKSSSGENGRAAVDVSSKPANVIAYEGRVLLDRVQTLEEQILKGSPSSGTTKDDDCIFKEDSDPMDFIANAQTPSYDLGFRAHGEHSVQSQLERLDLNYDVDEDGHMAQYVIANSREYSAFERSEIDHYMEFLPPLPYVELLTDSYYSTIGIFRVPLASQFQKCFAIWKSKNRHERSLELTVILFYMMAYSLDTLGEPQKATIDELGESIDLLRQKYYRAGEILFTFMRPGLAKIIACMVRLSINSCRGEISEAYLSVCTGIHLAQDMNLHLADDKFPLGNSFKQRRRFLWWEMFMFDRMISDKLGRCSVVDLRYVTVALPDPELFEGSERLQALSLRDICLLLFTLERRKQCVTEVDHERIQDLAALLTHRAKNLTPIFRILECDTSRDREMPEIIEYRYFVHSFVYYSFHSLYRPYFYRNQFSNMPQLTNEWKIGCQSSIKYALLLIAAQYFAVNEGNWSSCKNGVSYFTVDACVLLTVAIVRDPHNEWVSECLSGIRKGKTLLQRCNSKLGVRGYQIVCALDRRIKLAIDSTSRKRPSESITTPAPSLYSGASSDHSTNGTDFASLDEDSPPLKASRLSSETPASTIPNSTDLLLDGLDRTVHDFLVAGAAPSETSSFDDRSPNEGLLPDLGNETWESLINNFNFGMPARRDALTMGQSNGTVPTNPTHVPHAGGSSNGGPMGPMIATSKPAGVVPSVTLKDFDTSQSWLENMSAQAPMFAAAPTDMPAEQNDAASFKTTADLLYDLNEYSHMFDEFSVFG